MTDELEQADKPRNEDEYQRATHEAEGRHSATITLQPDDYQQWDLGTGELTGLFMSKAAFQKRFAGSEMEAGMVGGWYPISWRPGSEIHEQIQSGMAAARLTPEYEQEGRELEAAAKQEDAPAAECHLEAGGYTCSNRLEHAQNCTAASEPPRRSGHTPKLIFILTTLLQHYARSRAAGHTHLMIYGIDDAETPLAVVAVNQQHAQKLEEQIASAINRAPCNVIALTQLQRLVGGPGLPLAFDNFTLESLFRMMHEQLQESMEREMSYRHQANADAIVIRQRGEVIENLQRIETKFYRMVETLSKELSGAVGRLHSEECIERVKLLKEDQAFLDWLLLPANSAMRITDEGSDDWIISREQIREARNAWNAERNVSESQPNGSTSAA